MENLMRYACDIQSPWWLYIKCAWTCLIRLFHLLFRSEFCSQCDSNIVILTLWLKFLKNSATICFCKNVSHIVIQFFQKQMESEFFKNVSHIVQKSKWLEFFKIMTRIEFWFKNQWGRLLYVMLVISGLSLPRFCLAFILWEFLLKNQPEIAITFLWQNLIKVQHKIRRIIGFHSQMCQCVKLITAQSSNTELRCDLHV